MRPAQDSNQDSPVVLAANQVLQQLEAKRPGCIKQARLLDFGCGAGGVVLELRRRGISSFGCDISLEGTAIEETLDHSGLPIPVAEILREMEPDAPQIPFPDGYFDIVISNQVLEHVVDLPFAFREIRRVLKPGGCSIHFFPTRWDPMEAHVCIPFGTIFRGRSYLRFWANLGIRNQFQKGKSANEVANLNYDYLRQHTFYHSRARLREMLGDSFPMHSFIDREVREAAANRPGLVPWKKWVLKAIITLHLHKFYRPFWGTALWLEG